MSGDLRGYPIPGFVVQHFSDLTAVRCPFGTSRCALGGGAPHSLHLLDIRGGTALHLHRSQHETYVVLEGEGLFEFGETTIKITPGSVVSVQPGNAHRVLGDLRILTIVTPPFDPEEVEVLE